MHYIVGVLFLSFFRLCWSVLLFLSSVELLGIGPIPTILLSLLCLFWICIWIYWERLGLVFGTYMEAFVSCHVFILNFLYSLCLYVIHTLMWVMQTHTLPFARKRLFQLFCLCICIIKFATDLPSITVESSIRGIEPTYTVHSNPQAHLLGFDVMMQETHIDHRQSGNSWRA